MKASICFATCNKNDCLANTLYSISRQKTSFDFEVCIVDDHSDLDPWPIIKEFLPNAKYKRLEQKAIGFQAPNVCLDLVSPDSDIVILQSCDVLYINDNVVEELCRHVKPKNVFFAEIAEIETPTDMYKNFDQWTQDLLNRWPEVPLRIARNALHYWLFFLGAIMKSDLDVLNYRENCCDAIMSPKMKAHGFDAYVLTYIKGVHQKHPKALADCHMVEQCEYYCARTNKLKGTQPDPNFKREAVLIHE